jgi:carbon-monoxide dehydrogenase medium subunit
VAFTGVSDGPFRDTQVENALSGKAASADSVAAAAAQAAQGVHLLSDHFASEKYRLHLAQVFAKRALSEVTA